MKFCFKQKLSCLALLVCVPTIVAATASSSEIAPADRILVDAGGAPHANANVQFNRTINMDRFGGVAFPLAQDSSVDSVTFHVHGIGEGVASASAVVTIVAFDELAESALKKYPYNVIATQAVTVPSGIKAGHYFTIHFEKPVTLKKGNYGIMFQWAKPGQGREINFRTSLASNGNWYFRNTMNKDGDLIKQDVAGGTSGRGLFVVIQGEKSNP